MYGAAIRPMCQHTVWSCNPFGVHVIVWHVQLLAESVCNDSLAALAAVRFSCFLHRYVSMRQHVMQYHPVVVSVVIVQCQSLICMCQLRWCQQYGRGLQSSHLIQPLCLVNTFTTL